MKRFRYHSLTMHAAGVWNALHPRPIVIEEAKWIYFPIPKIASSTIKAYLLEHFNPSLKIHKDDPKFNIHAHVEYPTLPISQLKRLNGYTSFAVVRDPLDRIVSCYQEKIVRTRQRGERLRYGFRRYNQLLGRNLFDLEMSFDEFVRVISKIPDVLSDEHFRSQFMFMPRPSQFRVNHLIRIDELSEKMMELTRSTGAPEWIRKSVNRSTAGNRPRISADIAEILAKRYRKDYQISAYQLPSATEV